MLGGCGRFMRNICVFCGSRMGKKAAFAESARQMGRELASQGRTLVYGGGNVGLMGVVADAVMEAGGRAVGVIPRFLAEKEVAHTGLSELIRVETMHERKQKMADLADAFVALPGGFGTLEELGEILTWAQLGLHAKPFGLLNVGGFYDSLIRLFDDMTDNAFVEPENRRRVLVAEKPGDLLAALRDYRPPEGVFPMIERDQT